jgi:hypothetical protein
VAARTVRLSKERSVSSWDVYKSNRAADVAEWRDFLAA